MKKCRVSVLGRVLTKNDLKHTAKIERALQTKRPDIEVISIRKQAVKLPKQCKVSWMDNLFTLIVWAIDNSDMVVIVEPVSNPISGTGLVSWIIGYAYSVGVPVALLTDISKDTIEGSPVPVHCLHAHYIKTEELLSYDFNDKPFIPYKGKIK